MSTPVIPFKGRTFSRGRGCWNCVHFDAGPRARQHYFARRQAEVDLNPGMTIVPDEPGDAVAIARLAGALGISPDAARARLHGQRAVAREDARFKKFDKLLADGKLGMCTHGHAPADFCESTYLCDRWTGVDGASVATEGFPLDKLPEELREELDGPIPKKE